MKTKKRILSILIIFVLILSSSPVYAEDLSLDSEQTELISPKADPNEVTNPFETTAAWKAHLQEANQELKKTDLLHDNIQAVLKEHGVSGLSKYQYYVLLEEEGLEAFIDNHLLVSFNDGATSFQNQALNDIVLDKKLTADLFYTITLKESFDQNAFMALLGQVIADPNVAMAQPDFIGHYSGSNYWRKLNYETTSMTVALDQISASAAWKYSTGAGIKIGMIDTGVNDVGQNLDNMSSSDCTVTAGHGTSVSMVMGGNENVIGVAPDSIIFCLGKCRACNPPNDGNTYTHDGNSETTSNVAEDLSVLINDGICSIINLSLEFDKKDVFMDALTNYPFILFVQSAGNGACSNCSSGLTHSNCPLDLDWQTNIYTYYSKPNLIWVASVDRYDNLSGFSKYGDETVHIAAPGEDLILPGADGELYCLDGTSFAAPMVSAAAALLLEINYYLTPEDLKNTLLNNADVIPELQGKVQGARRLNVLSAVLNIQSEYETDVTPDYCDRYAYIDNNSVLRAKNSTTSSWTQIGTNVSSAILTDDYIYMNYTPSGGAGARDIKTFTIGAGVDELENVTSFSAVGDLLVTLDTSNTLRIYQYHDFAFEFSLNKTLNNVKLFSLCGNMLSYCYTTVPNILYVHPNICAWDSFDVTLFPAGGTIYNIFSGNGRIHYRFNTSGYAIVEYQAGSNSQILTRTVFRETWVNNNSINHNRWIYPEGNVLKVWRFNESGQAVEYGSVTAPNGQTITAAKVFGTRVLFLANGSLYGFEGDPNTATVHLIASNVSSFNVSGKMMSVIKNNGNCWAINGPFIGTWSMLGSNVSKVYLAP